MTTTTHSTPSTRTIAGGLAALGCAAALVGPPAAGAATVVDQLPRPTEVAAFDDHIVYSRYDPATQRYTLMHSVGGGAPVPLAGAAPAPRPFDVDLGTNTHGTVEAVYTRQDASGNADIYRLSLRDGATERHLTTISSPHWSESDPTLLRGSIAFVRRERVGGRVADTIRVATSEAGPTRAIAKGGSYSDPAVGVSHVAFVAHYKSGQYGFGQQNMMLARIRDGRTETIYRAPSGGAAMSSLTGPTLSETTKSFIWAHVRVGDPGGTRTVQYRIASHALAYAPASERWSSTAWTTSALGLATSSTWDGSGCYAENGQPSAESYCRVELTGPVRWTTKR